MNLHELRQQSINTLAANGLIAPASLPLLAFGASKGEMEAFNRLACLHLCSASAYGFPKEEAIAWAEAEGLIPWFEKDEAQFLRGCGNDVRFRFQIEGIFALCWALGFEQSFDWFDAVDDDFVHRLPNLKTGESSRTFRSRTKMRDAHEIVEAADLGYCLHWAWRDATLRGAGQKIAVEEYVIAERRRALEWLIGEYRWYEVSLDT